MTVETLGFILTLHSRDTRTTKRRCKFWDLSKVNRDRYFSSENAEKFGEGLRWYIMPISVR